jgi:SHS2 domain-containing protein
MAGHRGESGHELLPHTADVVVSAWGPTAELCFAEAVRGLVACFADVRHPSPDRAVPFNCEPAADSELLVQLLEEVIYLVDVHEVVPVRAAVARTAEGGLVGEFGVVALSSVDLVGPAPKAISRHGLRFAQGGAGWQCAVIVDV